MIHKEKICAAWTGQILTLGNNTTGRTEAMHRAIKKELPHRNLHIRDAVELYKGYLDRFNRSLEQKILVARERMDTQLRRDPVFYGLHQSISVFALRKVLEVVHLGRNKLPSICSHTIKRTHGLPCRHLYLEKKAQGLSFTVNDFHNHWRIDRLQDLPPIDPILLIKDPIRVRSRAQNEAGVQTRIPSFFEIVEAENTLPSQPELSSQATKRQRQRVDSERPRQQVTASSEPPVVSYSAQLQANLFVGEGAKKRYLIPAGVRLCQLGVLKTATTRVAKQPCQSVCLGSLSSDS
jgi:hypothetical protein